MANAKPTIPTQTVGSYRQVWMVVLPLRVVDDNGNVTAVYAAPSVGTAITVQTAAGQKHTGKVAAIFSQDENAATVVFEKDAKASTDYRQLLLDNGFPAASIPDDNAGCKRMAKIAKLI